MRQSSEVKAETNEAIVKAAAHMFRERGIEGTSVGDVMKAADKTHGGFYRHFASKEALLLAALERAFADMVDKVESGLGDVPASQALARLTAYYLSPEMFTDVAGGCPVAALSGDVVRSSDTVRAAFGSGTRRMIEAIAATLDGPDDERRRRATRTFAMAAGAMMIARAVDPETAAHVLGAVNGGGDDVAGGA